MKAILNLQQLPLAVLADEYFDFELGSEISNYCGTVLPSDISNHCTSTGLDV